MNAFNELSAGGASSAKHRRIYGSQWVSRHYDGA